MPKPKNVEKRIEELAHPDAEVRRRAARKLGEYGDYHAVEPLCRALRDEDSHVRRDAAKSLGDLAPSLGPRHREAAFEPLREALFDIRPGLRHAAAMALGQLGVQQRSLAPHAVFFILHAAQKSKAGDRHNYVDALTGMGAAAVAPLCVEFSSRRSQAMQECIKQALVSLEQKSRLDVAGALLADDTLTAPQQWEALDMLAAARPRNLFTPRHVNDARRLCEIAAADPRVASGARRGAQGVLDYLSLGRASQRYDDQDASQLLRMAHGEAGQTHGGESLLRGASLPQNAGLQRQGLAAKLQRLLARMRRRMGLS